MSDYSTCKICADDYLTEDMIEDITGAKYCLFDSSEICLVCGVYGHNCEEQDKNEPCLICSKSYEPNGLIVCNSCAHAERTVNDVVKELAEGGAVNL